MGLFQSTIQKKYLKGAEGDISDSFKFITSYFHNRVIQENICNSREEQFQEGFLRELFVKILGYTLYPEPNYNLIAELKQQKIALSLKQQDEWEEYFCEYKAACADLANQIRITDKEIDNMVYGLYGLTEKETGIIERNE